MQRESLSWFIQFLIDQPKGGIMASITGITVPSEPRVLAADTLTGDKVVNLQNEDLGKIEHLMIDLGTGRIAYAVLSFGGFLGLGDKLFAIPWRALRIDEGEHEFTLDVDRQTLDRAPGFDKDNWPDMADDSFATSIHRHYGQAPYWEHD